MKAQDSGRCEIRDSYENEKHIKTVLMEVKKYGSNENEIGHIAPDIQLMSPSNIENITLKRELGLFSAICLIISVMIGSGIFISPSSVLEKSGSVGLCLIIWAVCGAISYLGALCFAELGAVVGQSGGEYSYFQEAFAPLHAFFGPLIGFTYVWTSLFAIRPAEVTILALTFAEYTCVPIADAIGIHLSGQHNDLLKRIVALLAIGLITTINLTSVKLFMSVQNVCSTLKTLACLVVIAGGIYSFSIGEHHDLLTGFSGTKTSVKDLVLALYSGLWAFDGWTSSASVVEEIKSPEVNLPRSISLGVPLVTLLFFLMNVAYMTVLNLEEIVSAQAVAIMFSERLFGSFSFFVPLAVALSTFGCSLSVQFGVSRLCFVASRHGHMFKSFSYVHIRKYTPAPSVFFQGFLSACFVMSGNVVQLIEFVSFLVWIYYGLAMVSLLVLRKTQPDKKRPYKVPLFIPLVIAVISAVLAGVPLVVSPDPQYLFAVAFILLGVAVYYPFVYKNKRFGCTDKLNFIIQVLFEVVPPEGKNS